MAIHHIIPKHEWNKRFGNLDGIDAPDNLSPALYNHQHAHVHQLLYELNGCWEDFLAWKGTAGLIGKEEIICEINRINGLLRRGRKFPPHTEERRKRISNALRGVKHNSERNKRKSLSMLGTKRSLGSKHSLESRKRRSKNLKLLWSNPVYREMMMRARVNK